MNSLIGFIHMLLALTLTNPEDNPIDKIEGKWLTHTKGAVVEIYAEEGKYFGKVIEVLPLNDDPDIERPKLGTIILREFEKESNVYEGELYAPHREKVLNCEISLIDQNTMELSVSVFLFSKELTWTRYIDHK